MNSNRVLLGYFRNVPQMFRLLVTIWIAWHCHCAVKAAGFRSGKWRLDYPPNRQISTSGGETGAEIVLADPVIQQYFVSFSGLAMAFASPTNGEAHARAPNASNPQWIYDFEVQGPGMILVAGNGNGSGTSFGPGSPTPRAIIDAGGGLTWNFGNGVASWQIQQLDLRGQPGIQSRAASWITNIGMSQATLSISDNTRVWADAYGSAQTANGNASSSWQAFFIPTSLLSQGALNCGTNDICGSNADCVVILIHDFDKTSGDPWIVEAQTTLARLNMTSCAWDWSGSDSRSPLIRATDQGRALAKRLADCRLDPERFHFITDGYGAQVAIAVAENFASRGLGAIGELTAINMPLLARGIRTPILDSKTANFRHVGNFWSAGSFGAPICCKANVANVILLPNHPAYPDLPAHISQILEADNPAARGPCDPNNPTTGDFMLQGNAELVPDGFACQPCFQGNSNNENPPPFRVIQWEGMNATIHPSMTSAHFVTTGSAAAVLAGQVSFAPNIDYIRFEYSIPHGSGSDTLVLRFADEVLFSTPTWPTLPGALIDSLPIPVQGLKGLSGPLSFVTQGTNTEITITNFQFFTTPILRASINGTNISISWPVTTAPFALESANDLFSINSWNQVTNLLVVSNEFFHVDISILDLQQYFRLRRF